MLQITGGETNYTQLLVTERNGVKFETKR